MCPDLHQDELPAVEVIHIATHPYLVGRPELVQAIQRVCCVVADCLVWQYDVLAPDGDWPCVHTDVLKRQDASNNWRCKTMIWDCDDMLSLDTSGVQHG